MSVATLETYRDAANAALLAADYATAIKYAMAAKMMLATMPDASRGFGGGSQQQAWNRDAIDSFIRQCQTARNEAAGATTGGFRQIPITYARPDLSE